MTQVLLVALGGALGSVGRYLLTLVSIRALGPGFPYGTLLVNLLGSFLIGVVYSLAEGSAVTPGVRLFLTTGVMGGFTTYSAFNHETLSLFALGQWPFALLNVGATLAGCLLAGMAGVSVGRSLA